MRRTKPIDAHVGQRVRLRRKLLGLTQAELGRALGVTLQQVLKYERGLNRIGASRLYDLGQALDVPVSFFFDDMAPELSDNTPGRRFQLSEGSAMTYKPNSAQEHEILELTKDYLKISDHAVRKEIRGLVKALSRY